MNKSRGSRFVKRAVLALVAVALLLCSYVSSYLAVHLTGPSNFKYIAVNSWFYRPLTNYMFSNHPGHLEFRALCTWCMNQFYLPFSEYYESESMREREGGDLFESTGGPASQTLGAAGPGNRMFGAHHRVRQSS